VAVAAFTPFTQSFQRSAVAVGAHKARVPLLVTRLHGVKVLTTTVVPGCTGVHMESFTAPCIWVVMAPAVL
jgi:hypothetical protein